MRELEERQETHIKFSILQHENTQWHKQRGEKV